MVKRKIILKRKSNKPKSKSVSVRIPLEQRKKLVLIGVYLMEKREARGNHERVKLSDLYRRAIDNYIEKWERSGKLG